MKQSAVEWFYDKVIQKQYKDIDDSLEDLFEQAKEMEKQEQVYNKEIVNILDNVRYWETCPDNYKVIIEKFIEQFKNK